jgi:hypothetical protein
VTLRILSVVLATGPAAFLADHGASKRLDDRNQKEPRLVTDASTAQILAPLVAACVKLVDAASDGQNYYHDSAAAACMRRELEQLGRFVLAQFSTADLLQVVADCGAALVAVPGSRELVDQLVEARRLSAELAHKRSLKRRLLQVRAKVSADVALGHIRKAVEARKVAQEAANAERKHKRALELKDAATRRREEEAMEKKCVVLLLRPRRLPGCDCLSGGCLPGCLSCNSSLCTKGCC